MESMVVEGARLAVVGMATVFAFLTLLVVLMRASAAYFEANAHRFAADGDGDTGESAGDAELAVVLALAEARRRGQRV